MIFEKAARHSSAGQRTIDYHYEHVVGCRGGTRTPGLEVMSLTRYQLLHPANCPVPLNGALLILSLLTLN